jgi:hypothetical protein
MRDRAPAPRPWPADRAVRGLLALLTLASLATGCTIGPHTVARDRFDYSGAVAESWKSQMLLNLVKIRYGDPPVFLEVGQIVSGYTVQSTFQASGNIFSFNTPGGFNPAGVPSSSIGLGAQGQFTDRPTITYSPMVGERFARSFMTPVPPAAILSLIQAGNPADVVLRMMVHVVSGLHNRFGGDLRAQRADPAFYEFLERLRRIQLSGAIGMRLHRLDRGEGAVLMTFRRDVPPEVQADILAMRGLLRLDPAAQDLRVVYGSVPADDKEVAILSRSILEVLVDIASFIAVPGAHVAERQVLPTPEPEEGRSGPLPPLIRIASSPDRPANAFVAVPYQDHWFYIDNRDIPSKRLFSFLMFIFTLVETGPKEAPPVITIPTG